jgi:hypothetical protein
MEKQLCTVDNKGPTGMLNPKRACCVAGPNHLPVISAPRLFPSAGQRAGSAACSIRAGKGHKAGRCE